MRVYIRTDMANGSLLEKYELQEKLGAGGMGVVYRARDRQTGRIVALKRIRTASSAVLSGMRREIQCLARLNHPGVIRIIDYSDSKFEPWYAMELIHGVCLYECLPVERELRPSNWWTRNISGRMDNPTDVIVKQDESEISDSESGRIGVMPPARLQRIITVMRRVFLSMAYIHGEGIVHGDLKPDNIFVRENDAPVIMDFGLAGRFSGVSGRESPDPGPLGMGSLKYMSPEQLSGRFADAMSDLFALGCILYELLTDRNPFPVTRVSELRSKILKDDVKPPSSLVRGVPDYMDKLTLKLLRPQPAERIAYAVDAAAILSKSISDNRFEQACPTPRIYLHTARFAGRRNVVRYVDAMMAQTLANVGNIVFVAGESGIGKSRLLMEVTAPAKLQGFFVTAGACESTGAAPRGLAAGDADVLQVFRKPLREITDACLEKGADVFKDIKGPVADVLSRYEPRLVELIPELDRSVPHSSDLKGESGRVELFRSLAEFFMRFSQVTRLILVLEDLHWADQLTIGFLDYLLQVRSHEHHPILIIGTYRPEEADQRLLNLSDELNKNSIVLEPLTDQNIRSIVLDMIPRHDMSDVFFQHITENSEGNPFFATQYLMTCVEQDMLRRNIAGYWCFEGVSSSYSGDTLTQWPEFPGSLSELIQTRLALLSPDCRRCANLASVLAVDFDLSMIAAIAGWSDEKIWAVFKELARRRILVEQDDGVVAFTHEKIMEFAYMSIDTEYRCRLHKQAATLLESNYPEYIQRHPVRMGRHWEEAGDTAKAWRLYRIGAREAYEKYAFEESDRLYKRTLSMISPYSEDWIETAIDHAETSQTAAGFVTEAVTMCRTVLSRKEQIRSDRLLARLYKVLSMINLTMARFTDCRRFGRAALEIYAKLESPSDEVDVLGFLANSAYHLGRIEEAEALYEQSVQICRDLGDVRHECELTHIICSVYRRLGERHKIRGILQRNLAKIQAVSDPLIEAGLMIALGMDHYVSGEWETGRAILRKAETILIETRSFRQHARMLTDWAGYINRLGFLDEAEDMFSRSLSIHREFAEWHYYHLNMAHTGRLKFHRGEFKAGREFLNRAYQGFVASGNPGCQSEAMIWIAELLFYQGKITASEDLFKRALPILRRLRRGKRRFHVLCYVAMIFRTAERRKRADRIADILWRISVKHLKKGVVHNNYMTLGNYMIATGDLSRAARLIRKTYRNMKMERDVPLLKIELLNAMTLIRRCEGAGPASLRRYIRILEPLQRETGIRRFRIQILCEKGYIAHLSGHTGRQHLVQAEAEAVKMNLGSESVLWKSIDRLRRSVKAFEKGMPLKYGQVLESGPDLIST